MNTEPTGGWMLGGSRLAIRSAVGAVALAVAFFIAGCDAARVPIPDRESADLHSVDRLSTRFLSPEQLLSESRRAAICNIESIAGVSGAELGETVSVTPPFLISGWAYLTTGARASRSAWLRLKTGESERAEATEHPVFQTRDRPDVVSALKNPDSLRSGFVLNLESLKPGEYAVEIVFDAGPERVVCAHSRRIRVVAP